MSFPCLEFVYSLTQLLTQDSVILWETEGKGEQENEDYPKSRPLAGKRTLALIKCLMKV